MTHLAHIRDAACFVLAALLVLRGPASGRSPHARLSAVDPSAARWISGFWAERFALARDVVMPEMWRTMQIAGNGACYRNLEIAAGRARGEFRGNNWSDGDVYKWLEGAALIYEVTRSAELDRLMDDVIDTIGRAQAPDGYISTNIQIPEKQRWREPRDHEMYNMGHLLTAAAVHYRATGKKNFLAVAEKAAAYLYKVFQPRPKHLAHFGAPSNLMGFVDLYRADGDPRWLELAQIFVDMRGSQPGGTDHFQDRVPLRKETQVVGHAVHATYLYATAADLVAETGDRELHEALERLWTDMATRKMSVTGAVGQFARNVSPRRDITVEAFGPPYDLPNRAAYNETCANIGNALWNWRMLALTGDARYGDVFELVLYNSALAGMGLSGRDFFYTNVLRRLRDAGERMHNETLARWHNTTEPDAARSFCCPPNILRLLTGLHRYAYGISDGAVWVHLFGSSKLHTPLLKLTQLTRYPWDGAVRFTFDEATRGEVELRVRIPGWTQKAALTLNGAAQPPPSPGAYCLLRRAWKAGDVVELSLDMTPRLIEAHPLVESVRNHVAVARGPIVYCLESPDLPPDVRVTEVWLPASAAFAWRFEKNLLGGVTVLQTAGRVRRQGDWSGLLYRTFRPAPAEKLALRLIPYYAWANRGISEMTVWIPLGQ